MTTPDRPTTGGLQSPVGEPVQLGPSPLTQQYSRRSPAGIPPAQWGNHDAREDGEKECELFRDLPGVEGDPTQDVFLNRSMEWSTRTSSTLQQLQALPLAAVRM